ncbi:MAG: tetratricopeptide repeat protein [Inconstantimicrobium porci]|uniref:tetratricopeptide repeat protein n=1 Tax=Inconstantimicrobium porci TaxID=2652291 RepID=UPI002A917139|nr:tetratricopeptide repeat protein [Inconstantimicrobium porci]MDY5913375.1 tetratricopeptide repeat protein [Inconstantimicrobium porci]
MSNVHLLTPGEKIKKIRKDFKIKQRDITGGKITRNLISLIENNRADLTVSTAGIIVSSINDICKKRDIDFKMTTDDLLKNNTIQADKMLSDIIDEINEHMDDNNFDFSDIVDRAEMLIKENPFMDKVTDLYTELGKIFSDRQEFRKSYIFYFKAYERIDFHKQKELFALISLKLSYCCNNLYEFSESIQIINTILSLYNDFDELVYCKLLYNLAIAQKNINQYSDALSSLNKIDKELFVKHNYYFAMEIAKANCYTKLKLYKEALDIDLDLLNNYCNNDNGSKLLVLNNIAQVYKLTNNVESMRKYLLKAMDIISNYNIDENNYSMDELYYDLASCNIFIGNEKDALILLNKALDISKKQNKYKVQYDCINSMFDIYYENKQYKKLEEIKILLLGLLSESNKHEYHTLVYKFIKMYKMRNKVDQIDDLLNFMIDLENKEA